MFNFRDHIQKKKGGGYTVTRSNRKGKTHKVTGPDGTVKHFGDPNLKNRPNNPEAKKAWYARHKKSLAKNPHFRAYARATWRDGGYAETPYERSMGLLAGKNKFKFPVRGKQAMTMMPMGQYIKTPVMYQGFADGKLVDQGVAMPGQERFDVYGDEVHEYPIYQQGGYYGKGSRARVSYTPEAAQSTANAGSKVLKGAKKVGSELAGALDRTINNDYDLDDTAYKEAQRRYNQSQKELFNTQMTYLEQFPDTPKAQQIRQELNMANMTNPVDSNRGYGIYKGLKRGGYLRDKSTYITEDGKVTKRGLWSNVHLKKKREGKRQEGGDVIVMREFNPNKPSNADELQAIDWSPMRLPDNTPSKTRRELRKEKRQARRDARKQSSNNKGFNRFLTPQERTVDPYSIQSFDVPYASMAYNTLRFVEGPDREVPRLNQYSSEYLSGLRNLRYRPNYRPMYMAQNRLNDNIRTSTSSVPQMMANMQNASANLQSKMMDQEMQANNMNQKYRQSYLSALGSEGWRNAQQRSQIDQINAQNEARNWQFLAENAAGYDDIRRNKRDLLNAKLERDMQLTGVNARADDIRYISQPDGTVKEYYRDPVDGKFKPIKYNIS